MQAPEANIVFVDGEISRERCIGEGLMPISHHELEQTVNMNRSQRKKLDAEQTMYMWKRQEV